MSQLFPGVTPLQIQQKSYGVGANVITLSVLRDKAVTPFIQRIMYTETPCKKSVYDGDKSFPLFQQARRTMRYFV